MDKCLLACHRTFSRIDEHTSQQFNFIILVIAHKICENLFLCVKNIVFSSPVVSVAGIIYKKSIILCEPVCKQQTICILVFSINMHFWLSGSCLVTCLTNSTTNFVSLRLQLLWIQNYLKQFFP